MSNPYDDIFDDESGKKQSQPPIPPEALPQVPEPLEKATPEKESLDEILDNIELFNHDAEAFSKLLSETRSIDHKETKGLLQYFVIIPEKDRPENLKEEREYHNLLSRKFERIITPMVNLAKIHLQTIKIFNEDIDDSYYSVEQSDGQVKINKTLAQDGINLQRKVLADGADNLSTLETALEVSESRLSNYVNTGGINNISAAELVMITQKRTQLTSGLLHKFDYSFFTINLLDKTALTLGVHFKETSSQYINKLSKAFSA